jgi:hypothetical protein
MGPGARQRIHALRFFGADEVRACSNRERQVSGNIRGALGIHAGCAETGRIASRSWWGSGFTTVRQVRVMMQLTSRFRIAFFAVLVCTFGAASALAEGDPGNDCEAACQTKATAAFNRCREAGGTEAACFEKQQAVLKECLATLCQPEPPPTPTCEEGCRIVGEEMLRKCKRDDGTVDPNCEAAVERAVEQCLANCANPPPPSCEALCKEAFLAEVEACVEAGGGEDACWMEHKPAYQECLETQCGQEPPPPPPTCDKCRLLGQEMSKKCARDDGTVDPACQAEVERTVERCLANCVEPPPTPDCEQVCNQAFLAEVEACVARGGNKEACYRELQPMLAECIARECSVPPQTCEDKCAALERELKNKCVKEDGSVGEACLLEVAKIVASCYANCTEPPPPVEPTCEESCRARAEEVLKSCSSQNLPEEECKAKYERALKACLAENCPVEPPTEVTCEEKCQKYSREVYDACVKEEVPGQECESRAAEAFRSCAAGCSEPPPPDDTTCEARCEDKAAAAMRACLQNGGTEAQCKEHSQAAYRECKAACGTVPPEPPACDEDCVAKAESLFKTCVAAGGEERECRSRADAMLGLCLERCSGVQPCESRCALAAQLVMTGCSLGGLPSGECTRLANIVLEGCVGTCQGEPTCPDRCERIAQSAVRECMARGGTETECKAKGDEIAASCLEGCEGEPVPACDVQCEEKADAMVQTWVAEGRTEREIAALRARFLEECLQVNGENCVEEAKVDLTVFRAFRRGDTNRDGDVNVSDPISTLGWLFRGAAAPPCDDAMDANDDGRVDISDPVRVLRYLFMGESNLPQPFDGEGQDPTSDTLVCSQ